MSYRYLIVDVFSDGGFGGNPLAVLPDASGLDSARMQRIAREFNFAETTFVLPAPAGSDAALELRIFTPTREVPFAGHPNIGTAFALAGDGRFGDIGAGIDVVFAEAAGPVPIRIEPREHGGPWCELRAPQALSLGAPVAVEPVAAILGLEPGDIRSDRHAPLAASVGLEFLMVELATADALARASVQLERLRVACDAGLSPDLHCYVRDGRRIEARMFAPLDGVPEDPATGSANCALAGLLTTLDDATDGDFDWQITQGVAMGRASRLDARTRKRDGVLTDVWIGGRCMSFAAGRLSADWPPLHAGDES